MRNYLKTFLSGKKVLILGYGREGRSTLNLINSILPHAYITIADQQESAFANDFNVNRKTIKTITGVNYMDGLSDYDVIIKSPGIKLDQEITPFVQETITSQTDLFLAVYGNQTVGITGTKGKSTTSSLLHHILYSFNGKSLLGGNIGIPPFDLVDRITPETIIVCELSSHQLQFTKHAPHIGVLLNLFQEHLDHYSSYLDYQRAKFNIALNQKKGDYFIYTNSDQNISALVSQIQVQGEKLPYVDKDNSNLKGKQEGEYSGYGIFQKDEAIILSTNSTTQKILSAGFSSKLTGTHNRNNAIIAAACASLLNVPSQAIEEAISTFNPLEHRLEFTGTFGDVKYFNDSISTIPEAAIAAIESLKPVDTLILGGYDRSIDYEILAKYLSGGVVKNVVATGPAGLRIFELIQDNHNLKQLHYFSKFDEAVLKAIEITPKGGVCLLSPAASSYNEFVNFEARGKRFKDLVGKKDTA